MERRTSSLSFLNLDEYILVKGRACTEYITNETLASIFCAKGEYGLIIIELFIITESILSKVSNYTPRSDPRRL